MSTAFVQTERRQAAQTLRGLRTPPAPKPFLFFDPETVNGPGPAHASDPASDPAPGRKTSVEGGSSRTSDAQHSDRVMGTVARAAVVNGTGTVHGCGRANKGRQAGPVDGMVKTVERYSVKDVRILRELISIPNSRRPSREQRFAVSSRIFFGQLIVAFVLAALISAPAFAADALNEPDEDSKWQLKGEAKARLQNVEQMLNDWDVAGARRELEAAEKIAPKDIEPIHYFKGRVLFEEGKYAEAVEQLELAKVSDKPRSWLRLIKDTQALTEKYERQESEHFIFTYPKGKDAVLAPWALEALESMAKAMKEDVGYFPTEKVRVEVVSNSKELATVSTLTRKQIQDTGTIAICKFNKLMVTSPKALLHGYDWIDTVAHEYVHFAVSHQSRNTVPIWLHEGLAKFLESRWRGPYGAAMTPSTLALLGSRVRKNTLVPFEKMHPSMALLPTAEDAATAFAEVYFAIDLLYRQKGNQAFERLVAQMAAGETDQKAVSHVFGAPFPQFEKAWLAHVKKQPFPQELIPRSQKERTEDLVDAASDKPKKKKPKDVSFGDFKEVEEADARKWAHLGELMRERNRVKAAAEHFQLAWNRVKDRYESVSNKYALTLLELKRYDEAEKVLRGSLAVHPGSGSTSVHLGRILLRQKAWEKAKDAYLDALAVNPFNPEVHVALYRCYDALNNAPLKQRAIEGLKILAPDFDFKQLDALAKRLEKSDDLSHVDWVETPATSADAGP